MNVYVREEIFLTLYYAYKELTWYVGMFIFAVNEMAKIACDCCRSRHDENLFVWFQLIKKTLCVSHYLYECSIF
jgi:hypothetical protein